MQGSIQGHIFNFNDFFFAFIVRNIKKTMLFNKNTCHRISAAVAVTPGGHSGRNGAGDFPRIKQGRGMAMRTERKPGRAEILSGEHGAESVKREKRLDQNVQEKDPGGEPYETVHADADRQHDDIAEEKQEQDRRGKQMNDP